MKDKEEQNSIAENARILRELLEGEWNGRIVIRAGENLLGSISDSGVDNEELYNPNGAYLQLIGILSQLDDVDLSLHQDFYHKSESEVELWIHNVIAAETSALLEAAHYFETKYGVPLDSGVSAGIDNARTFLNYLFGDSYPEVGCGDSEIVFRFLQDSRDTERLASLIEELRLRSAKMTESHAMKWLLIDCKCTYEFSLQGYTALQWIARIADLLEKGMEL